MKDYILRQNVVVISGSSENTMAYLQSFQNALASKQAAQLQISCVNCNEGDIDSIAICIVQLLMKKTAKRLKVRWINLPVWLKYRKENKRLSGLIDRISRQETLPDIYGLLSREHRNITGHIRRLLELEQKEYLIIIISEFGVLEHNIQPVVASLLHRLVKGSPAYFQIISVDEPHLFQKDDTGEIGIQRNHDYIVVTL
jgi:hypothetical protein